MNRAALLLVNEDQTKKYTRPVTVHIHQCLKELLPLVIREEAWITPGGQKNVCEWKNEEECQTQCTSKTARVPCLVPVNARTSNEKGTSLWVQISFIPAARPLQSLNDDLSQPFLRAESHHSKIWRINYTLPQTGAKYTCKHLSLCRKQNSVMLGRSKKRNKLISNEIGKENSQRTFSIHEFHGKYH